MRQLPNLLSLARIAATPAIVYLLLTGRCEFALPLGFAAGMTDALDGYTARRLGVESRLGAQLDPIADKFMLVSLYLAFGVTGAVPGWLVWLVVGRDVLILAMVAAGLLLTHVRDFPPLISGKVSTVLQIAGALVFLWKCRGLTGPLQDITVSLIAFGTLWSGIRYIQRGMILFHTSRTKV